ncbi:MAG: hypothetical protein ACI9XO_003375 [Paraglaciecola sp.]|jgi:hypothetical protein
MLSNKIYQYLSIFILFGMLTGCTTCAEDRGQLTILEGQVFEVESGNPAVGASVAVWRSFDEFTGLPDDVKELSKEIITDSMGFYSITFFNTVRSFFSVQVTPNALFNCSESSRIDIGEKNVFDFFVSAQDTLLELHFTKTDFDNNPDSVAVSINFEMICLINNSEINNYVLSTNLNIDSTLQIFTQPNVLTRLRVAYFEDGVAVKYDNISLTTELNLKIVSIEY